MSRDPTMNSQQNRYKEQRNNLSLFKQSENALRHASTETSYESGVLFGNQFRTCVVFRIIIS